MDITETNIKGLQVVISHYQHDERGAFARIFCDKTLEHMLKGKAIKQINHSINTKAGQLRGMHYQNAPFAEMKMIRCIKGRVFDVAIDIRKQSPTFLQFHAEELSAGDGKMVMIPEGFAHGFQAMEEGSELIYLHTEVYHPESEGGLHPQDPVLEILWPLPVVGLSERDARHPLITKDFNGIAI